SKPGENTAAGNTTRKEGWKGKKAREVEVCKRCIVSMAGWTYGVYGGTPEMRRRQDAYGFLGRLDSLTGDEDNHFTKADVKDALKALKADNKLLSTMTSRAWIEKQTKYTILPDKLHERKQSLHAQ
ncbi:hypothetical protein BGU93_18730, partial [Clostridioides difficile]